MSTYYDLVLWSETVDDFERSRIALENRIRAMAERQLVSSRMEHMLEDAQRMEREAIKGLERAVASHPLGPWIATQHGIGLKQAGRLLGTIGDPGERPNVAKLWAYCGMHVVEGEAPRHRRGEQGNWNDKARSRIRLIAESCLKHKGSSPYGRVYDEARIKYQDATHSHPCIRCGPSGHPAPEGSPLNDGHKHARALRIVAKEILKDMWVESQRLRQDHNLLDPQPTLVLA